MTNETPEEKAAREYEEQERLIAENRLMVPEKPFSQVIRWVYRSKINDTVYCMNEEGETISTYSGKFTDQASRILRDAPAEAEFYVSFSGAMDFVKQTREQWGQ